MPDTSLGNGDTTKTPNFTEVHCTIKTKSINMLGEH